MYCVKLDLIKLLKLFIWAAMILMSRQSDVTVIIGHRCRTHWEAPVAKHQFDYEMNGVGEL